MAAIVRQAFPALLCLWLISGCSIGPTVIRNNMVRYNESVVDTENEQFLLNLVRIRYGEIPKTLGVSQVTSQFTLTGQSPFSGTLTHFARAAGQTTPMALAAFTGGFQTNISDVPTVTFLPQSGADFNRGLVVPLGLDRVVLLAGTGWDLETVLRLTVQSLNRVENMPHLITQVNRPVRYSTEFNEVVAVLGRIHHETKLYLSNDPQPVLSKGVLADALLADDKKDAAKSANVEIKGSDLLNAAQKSLRFVKQDDGKVVLRRLFDCFKMNVDDDAFDPELICALNRLKVGTGKETKFRGRQFRLLPVDQVANDPEENDILVSTRNVIGCSVFASKGVDIPEAHYREGLVEPAFDEMGQPFDWTTTTKGLFHVCVQKHRPRHAYVACEHRGYWYFIADDDMTTKTSFALLKEMFDVQIAPGLSTAPILTISASGNTP